MKSEEKSHIYEFGTFRLDTAKPRLLRDGEIVPLTPKALEMLTVLVENCGRVVEKDELLKVVWHSAFVEEGVLSVNAHGLRKALGENGELKYIETVPKRGYRFVAPVREIADWQVAPDNESHSRTSLNSLEEIREEISDEPDAGRFVHDEKHYSDFTNDERRTKIEINTSFPPPLANEANVASDARQSQNSRAQSAIVFAALLCVITVAAAFALPLWLKREGQAEARGTTATEPARTLAVLPFKSLNSERTDEDRYFRRGLTDALITKLGGLRQLVVRPTSAVLKYDDENKDALAAGRELNVEQVLEGTLQREDERVRVTLRLLNVRDGAQLWSGVFDDKSTNRFALEDSITAQITRALSIKLTGAEQADLSKRPTTNIEAYELYLRGRYLWNKREFHNDKAIEYLERAIDLDPQFALAYATLAEVTAGYPQTERAEALAQSAIALDDTLGEAHAALGFIKLFGRRDVLAAERSLRRAVELDENYAPAHQWLALLHAVRGEHEAAKTEMRRALALDPLSVGINADMAQVLYFAREYEAAEAQAQRALELDSTTKFARKYLFDTLVERGKHREAIEQHLQCKQAQGLEGKRYEDAARGAFAQDGWRGFLTHVVRTDGATVCAGSLNGAEIYALLGDKEQTLQRLERSSLQANFWFLFVKVDPRYDVLQDDARFKDLLVRAKLSPATS